jgi:hypothetical protein
MTDPQADPIPRSSSLTLIPLPIDKTKEKEEKKREKEVEKALKREEKLNKERTKLVQGLGLPDSEEILDGNNLAALCSIFPHSNICRFCLCYQATDSSARTNVRYTALCLFQGLSWQHAGNLCFQRRY